MIDWENLELPNDDIDFEKLRGRLSLGKVTFFCRQCQAVTVVELEDIERMTGFRCGKCGLPMTTARFARLKMCYYASLYVALTQPPFGGEGPEMFKVEMDFDPHYEQKREESDG